MKVTSVDPTKSDLKLSVAAISLALLGVVQPAQGQSLTLAQYPAGTGARLPAPNVIISVDDSGSMGSSGIATLKAALLDTFSSTNVPDGGIRLAWQSMNRCVGIPSSSTACGGKNGMKVFSGQHRTNFTTWVNTLDDSGGTPSHKMVRGAGDYLMKTNLGVNSPWAADPGTTEAPILTCRKSYHLFMTDGGWNSSATSTDRHVDADRTSAGTRSTELGDTAGNIDGTARTLGDGQTQYSPATNQTRIYSDNAGYAASFNRNGTVNEYGLNTLADLAFYYWAVDLQGGIANEVKPTIRVAGNESYASGSSIAEFWNPKNNPATWQHMVTYTVGFGDGASSWTGAPAWGTDTHTGTGYTNLLKGTDNWPSPLCSGNSACDGSSGYSARENPRRVELWHMAINGRGKFIPAPTATALAPAFKEILNEIIADNTLPVTSYASASISLARSDTLQFAAGYNADGWTGSVSASTIAAGSGTTGLFTGWGVTGTPSRAKTTAEVLDALSDAQTDNRVILTWRDGSTGSVVDGATVFKWATDQSKLNTAQKNSFKVGSDTDAQAQDRLNFIRGYRVKEGQPLRVRKSRQGDIVNSNVWYAGKPASNYSLPGYRTFAADKQNRTPMVYVGGNDGMLHGFSTIDGTEKIAYVPKALIPDLKLLTQPGYNNAHRYFVDGSPFTGDVNWGTDASPNWRTLLFGSLGAGGRGYVLLDVTDPATLFVESRAAEVALVDNTVNSTRTFTTTELDADPLAADLGHIVADPVVDDTNPYKSSQIAKLNNGRWALITGNGYNSARQRPVLLIQYLNRTGTQFEVKRLVAGTSSAVGDGNGLSAPRPVDLDGNGTVDVVYAGDLKGNLWKFDLLSTDATRWNVAFSNQPLYTAVAPSTTGSGTGLAQPITAPPTARANSRGAKGMMVAFGTGRNLTVADRDTTGLQTVYSVLDNTRYVINGSTLGIDTGFTPTRVGTGYTSLVEQTVSSTTVTGTDDRAFATTSSNTVNYEGSNAKRGWYLNLPVTGERVLDPLSFYDGSNLLEVLSEIPASGGDTVGETCEPQSRLVQNYYTLLNIMDGKPPSFQVLDLNGDGYYNSSDSGVSRLPTQRGPKYDNITSQIGQRVNKRGDDEWRPAPITPIRPNWRQAQ